MVRCTWKNNKTREAIISKFLDHFLVHHALLEKFSSIISWVDTLRVLDHFPSYLQLSLGESNPRATLKYIPTWYVEVDFREIVKST